jgi:hypothetical protein
MVDSVIMAVLLFVVTRNAAPTGRQRMSQVHVDNGRGDGITDDNAQRKVSRLPVPGIGVAV